MFLAVGFFVDTLILVATLTAVCFPVHHQMSAARTTYLLQRPVAVRMPVLGLHLVSGYTLLAASASLVPPPDLTMVMTALEPDAGLPSAGRELTAATTLGRCC